MGSQDDLALLKRMYEQGEISGGQYDTLRRHVLWGTPLPSLMDDVPGPDRYVAGASTVDPNRYRPTGPPAPPVPPAPAAPQVRPAPPGELPLGGGRHSAPTGTGLSVPAATGYTPAGRRYASRRERREAEEAAARNLPPPAPPAGEDRVTGGRAADRSIRGPSDFGTAAGLRAAVEDMVSAGVYPLAGSDAEPAPRRRAEELAERRDRRGSVRADEPEEADEQRLERKGKRAPHRRSLLTVLTSLVVALALVAAGVWWFALRKEGVPPSVYARETCGSVRDWQQAVDSSNAALVAQIAREKDRTKIRTAVATYYGTIAARTDQLRSTILAQGAVDLTDGRAYADSLAAAIGDQARTLRDLAARADRLDAADPTAFQTTLPTLLTGADTAVSEVSAALARPAAGITTELRSALSDDPSCAPYVG